MFKEKKIEQSSSLPIVILLNCTEYIDSLLIVESPYVSLLGMK